MALRSKDGAVAVRSKDEAQAAARPNNGAARSKDGAARSKDGAARSKDGAARSKDGAARSKDGAARSKDGAARSKNGRAPRAGRTPRTRSAGGPLRSLRVRMYRVGFGDFFLVSVPSKGGPQHILIDCGVTRGKTGNGDIASIKAAVRHMAAETGGKLALIIVTHRHQDHIVGFTRCAEEFLKFQVDAIWMPYWETEIAQVHDFQAQLETLALDVRAAALAGDADHFTDEILGIVENATGVGRDGPRAGTNAHALDLLKNRLGVKPDYYYKGQKPRLPKSLVDAGLRCDILGPPPPDELEFLKLQDFKKGVGQYLSALRAAPGAKGSSKMAIMPFGPQYIASAGAYLPNAFREWAPRIPGARPDLSTRHNARLEVAVQRALPHTMLLAARKLDGIFNNQSLVVLFTWNERKLLFAGDAQAGNWEYWLYDLDKPKSNPSGEKLAKEGAAILGSIDFYKVGHHGSTNSTPISAVEAMNTGFVAMCSTQHDTFGSVANQSEVPRKPLLEALGEKGALVCSDQIPVTVDGVTVPAAKGAPARLPTPRRGRLERGECYIDYFCEE
jgi:beta-lactamase superfamily II metal-dependent hydrolase